MQIIYATPGWHGGAEIECFKKAADTYEGSRDKPHYAFTRAELEEFARKCWEAHNKSYEVLIGVGEDETDARPEFTFEEWLAKELGEK
jgi:hypothetical protein